VLNIRSLEVRYGGMTALDGVSLALGEGRMLAVIGPNGAGKSSLFSAISGTAPVSAGRIEFEGCDLERVPPHERARLGIAHVPEGRQVFASLTVRENIEVGAQMQRDPARRKRALDQVYALFPVLAQRGRQLAGMLSGGQQQMLAIGRGLASDPRLLMLDEPSMGLAPAVVDTIFECIAAVRSARALTVLLAEQRAAEAIEASDDGLVLQSGRVALQGSRDVLMADPQVRRLYLGL
jgi:branched-chain amino acid transport system ATP-binding protein